jgi:hypothetical protein
MMVAGDPNFAAANAFAPASIGFATQPGVMMQPLAAGSIIDLENATEIAMLLDINLGAGFATPATMYVNGERMFVSSDAATPIDPTTLPAVDLGPALVFGPVVTAISGSWFVGNRAVGMPGTLGLPTAPGWLGYAPPAPMPAISWSQSVAAALAAGNIRHA